MAAGGRQVRGRTMIQIVRNATSTKPATPTLSSDVKFSGRHSGATMAMVQNTMIILSAPSSIGIRPEPWQARRGQCNVPTDPHDRRISW